MGTMMVASSTAVRGGNRFQMNRPRSLKFALTCEPGWLALLRFASRDRMEHMPGIYKVTEIVGTSPTSFADAARAAVAEAAKTIRHLDWFDVVKESGRIEDGKVVEFQVTVKVGFKLER